MYRTVVAAVIGVIKQSLLARWMRILRNILFLQVTRPRVYGCKVQRRHGGRIICCVLAQPRKELIFIVGDQLRVGRCCGRMVCCGRAVKRGKSRSKARHGFDHRAALGKRDNLPFNRIKVIFDLLGLHLTHSRQLVEGLCSQCLAGFLVIHIAKHAHTAGGHEDQNNQDLGTDLKVGKRDSQPEATCPTHTRHLGLTHGAINNPTQQAQPDQDDHDNG